MRSLTGSHIKALGEAISVVYTPTEEDDFGEILIQAADVLFKSTKISVDEVLVPDGQVVHWADKDFPPSTQQLWPLFSHEHPAVNYIAGGGRRPVIAISDFLTQREFQHLGLYHEIYRPNAIRDQIATLIPLRASTLGLAICGEKPFRQVEKDCLTALHPHLLPAYNKYQQRIRMSRKLRLTSQALEATREGIVFCTRTGRIGMANRVAQKLLKSYFLSAGRDPMKLPAAIQKAIGKLEVGSMEIPGPGGVLRVTWSPAPDTGYFLLLAETRADSVKERALSLGLSPRESDVAQWLVRGKTNDEISRLLGISRHTSRTHVERILAKLQVTTRTAVAARLMA
jgi:DNA-binding CsgD family transcriptional regulator